MRHLLTIATISPMFHWTVSKPSLKGIVDQDLRLPCKTRHVHDAHRPATRAIVVHEALFRGPIFADVARLPLRVVRARLDRLRDGLLVFFVCIILFCVAAAVDPFTNLLVAAAPVVMLASRIAIASVTSNTTRRVVGQWGGAGGAICEDHFVSAAGVEGRALGGNELLGYC